MELGIDRFIRERSVTGQRVGLLTNYASFTSEAIRTVDALSDAGAKSLVIFGPEHGFWGEVQYMETGTDRPYRNLQIASLYGEDSGHHLFPAPADIAALDVLIVDLQDVGARYYTYYASMVNCMEVAAVVKTPVIVLDRPNPINGIDVEGKRLRPPFISFVGQYPISNRHGLTIGEIATFLNERQQIGCDLTVIWMKGWRRERWWDETGLPWDGPSPNIPSFETTIVFPGMGLFEGTMISEGRGTTRPFERFGAPWLDEFKLADALNELALPGVRFSPFVFLPQYEKHAGARCHGAAIHVTDRKVFRPLEMAARAVKLCRDLAPDQFRWRTSTYEFANCSAIDTLTGGVAFRCIVDTGGDLDPLLAEWREDAAAFDAEKKAYEHPGYAKDQESEAEPSIALVK